MQLNHYLISTFSTQNSNNSLIIERYTPYVIRNIRSFILSIKQTSIMEELELRKFWKSIGITTLLIMLGIAISGSLIIIKSNKKSDTVYRSDARSGCRNFAKFRDSKRSRRGREDDQLCRWKCNFFVHYTGFHYKSQQ